MLVVGAEAEGHACANCGTVTSEIAHRTTRQADALWLCSPHCTSEVFIATARRLRERFGTEELKQRLRVVGEWHRGDTEAEESLRGLLEILDVIEEEERTR